MQSPEAYYDAFHAKKRAKVLLFFELTKYFCKKMQFCRFYLRLRNIFRTFACYLYAHLRTYMKQLLYILGVLLVSLTLVGGMVVGALMSDDVETAAVQLATKELSKILGTDAHVGAVEYRFPAKIAFKDIYLADQQGDTLGYIGERAAQRRSG